MRGTVSLVSPTSLCGPYMVHMPQWLRSLFSFKWNFIDICQHQSNCNCTPRVTTGQSLRDSWAMGHKRQQTSLSLLTPEHQTADLFEDIWYGAAAQGVSRWCETKRKSGEQVAKRSARGHPRIHRARVACQMITSPDIAKTA